MVSYSQQDNKQSTRGDIKMLAILTIVGMFLIRIGVPLIALIIIGTLIDRHQTKQHAQAQKIYKLEQHSEENTAHKAA